MSPAGATEDQSAWGGGAFIFHTLAFVGPVHSSSPASCSQGPTVNGHWFSILGLYTTGLSFHRVQQLKDQWSGAKSV